MTPFQQKLSNPIQLPSLAKNIHVLMQALAKDSLTYKQLAEVIKHYPVITSRIIFLANSPWSAPIAPINSIEQACSRLGISMVKSISIAISVASSFDTQKCPEFCMVRYWSTSMLVAEGAGLLAAKLPNNPDHNELELIAQTSGVLHNLGLLWLADKLPNETARAFQQIENDPLLTVSKTLKQSTGADYCEVGAWIGNQLQLPDSLISVMQHHRNEDYQEESWELALLVGAAAEMVSALHQQLDDIPINTRLETLGLDSSEQKLIYQKLAKDFDKTRELVETLFLKANPC
ncbi:MAG: HDOD domain-containing protein [Methylococcaceae bacterium]|nr:HDOD domain-containing protein [Methylococcaceae bacterium]